MEDNINISERMNELVEFLNISKNDLANKLGYKRAQSIYDMANGKSKPSFDFFHKILNSEYSEIINIEYLISGKGKIFKTKEVEHIEFENVYNEYGNLEIKKINGKFIININGYNKNGQEISETLYNLLKKELKHKT